MDLRAFNPSREQVEQAVKLLHYQPFILDDRRHTGVAYSWLYSQDPTDDRYGSFLFDKDVLSPEVWERAWDANRRLAAMYDGFLDAVIGLCRGGAFLDVGCNTGYLPVKASLAGVAVSVGIDRDDYSAAFSLLNAITGSRAAFFSAEYDPCTHSLPFGSESEFDVVMCTAVLCHVPDPLHYLTAICRLAKRAVLLWSGFIESQELLIRYNPANKFMPRAFPNGFDDGTSLSTGLLFHAMDALRFRTHVELRPESSWLSERWTEARIPHYQQFRAFVFFR